VPVFYEEGDKPLGSTEGRELLGTGCPKKSYLKFIWGMYRDSRL
jgi:hypothetical protein